MIKCFCLCPYCLSSEFLCCIDNKVGCLKCKKAICKKCYTQMNDLDMVNNITYSNN
jgi:hypothetical protein